MPEITGKHCTLCGEYKTLDAFHRCKSNSTGYATRCKLCVNEKAKIYYRQHPERTKVKKEYMLARLAADPDYLRKINQRYSENHPGKVAQIRKSYHLRHPEKRREHYLNNKTKINEQNKQWYQRNKAKRSVTVRKWCEQNREACRVYYTSYRARRRTAEGAYTKTEWLTLCQAHDNKCVACGRSGAMTVDHIVPLSKGGTNYISNIQPLCGSCNSSKNNVHATDYRTYAYAHKVQGEFVL